MILATDVCTREAERTKKKNALFIVTITALTPEKTDFGPSGRAGPRRGKIKKSKSEKKPLVAGSEKGGVY